VPQLLVLPIAGNLVDRLNRRLVIIVSDCAVAVMSVAVILLLWWNELQVIHLYAFTLIAALASAFKDPAYRASIGTMLRDDQLTRASGLLGISTTALGIIAPTLAGALIVMVGLTGLAILDLVTFSIGSIFIWRAFVYHSAPPVARGGIRTVLGQSLDNFRRSLSFFVQSVAMRGMFFYSLIQTALLALAATLAIPLILAVRLSTAVIVLFGATLADTWLEAALTPGRTLASIGELLLNVPNGRGIAMLFVISGALGLVAVLGGYACKPLLVLYDPAHRFDATADVGIV
jgi:MFS family permease